MINKPTLFSYVVRVDYGSAPNPYHDLCTLVICKPVIRRTANKNDWIVGLGSKDSPLGDISNKVAYAMKVTKKMKMKEYDGFCKEKYPGKIPDWNSSDYRRLVGDSIYDFSDPLKPKIRKSVHTEKNKERDLGGEYALLSNDFYYFGNKPEKLPKNLLDIIKDGPGHKSKSNKIYVEEFIRWISKIPKNKDVEPINKINPSNKDKICGTCSECDHKDAEDDEILEKLKKC